MAPLWGWTLIGNLTTLLLLLSSPSLYAHHGDYPPREKMPNEVASSAPPSCRRQRVRIACRRCNTRKVRCDASQGIPCQGCISAHSECVLIDSQRGRYPRRRSQGKTSNLGKTETNPRFSSRRPSPELDDVSLRNNNEKNCASLTDERVSRPFDVAETDSNALLYSHIADQGVSSVPQPITDPTSTLFLGESFSLTYVVHHVLAPLLGEGTSYQRRLHFPIVEQSGVAKRDSPCIIEKQRCLLAARNILCLPSTSALETLLRGYFRWFHPAYPVVQPLGFIDKCLRGEMSLLVLNALLIIAVTICDDCELQLTGIASRYEARKVFYLQAKTLYDADLDPDKTNNVISLFLMSFWWDGPVEQKDSWHWMGVAIGLAQSMGMHRSTAQSHMNTQTAKHWARIWWSLRVRDSLVSGSIGRPQHFSIWDCDIEMLEPEQTSDGSSDVGEAAALYSVQMAHLSIIFSDIVRLRYSVNRPPRLEDRKRLENALYAFRANIPPILQYFGMDPASDRCHWSAMLLMAYNFGVILLCRPTRRAPSSSQSDIWGDHNRALGAANEVTRVMEDILAVSMGRLCQIHTIPALFNSLAMHVFSMCTAGTIGRELAENRARICMLGLKCLQLSWPVSRWILQLFVDIMNRLKVKIAQQVASRGSDRGNPPAISRRSSLATGYGQREPLQQDPPLQPTTVDRMTPPEADEPVLEVPESPGSPVHPLQRRGSAQVPGAWDYEQFPNLFVLDQPLGDFESEQGAFFDLLQMPSWDTMDLTSINL